MIHDPDLIHFACIAKGTTILAEFNPKHEELGSIAAKCLANTPPFHSFFTHTVRSKTYTFLIDQPLTYFAIFDAKLENSEGLAFLKSVRDAFHDVSKGEKKLENLSPHCYQGEFNPVFHQLLRPGLDHMEVLESPVGRRISESGMLQLGQATPVRGRGKSGGGDKGLKRIKNRLFGQFKMGGTRKKENDEDEGSESGSNHEFSLVKKNGGMYSGELMGHQKAKSVWRKQVVMVLVLDLIFCAVLFAVWLWVCSGFQCVNN